MNAANLKVEPVSVYLPKLVYQIPVPRVIRVCHKFVGKLPATSFSLEPHQQYRGCKPDISRLPILCRVLFACLITHRVLVSLLAAGSTSIRLALSATRIHPLPKHALPYMLVAVISRFSPAPRTPTFLFNASNLDTIILL